MAVLSRKRARSIIDDLPAHDLDAYAACEAAGVAFDEWRSAVDSSDELSARLKRRRLEFAENKLMQRVAAGDRHAIEYVMSQSEPEGEYDAAVAAFIQSMKARS